MLAVLAWFALLSLTHLPAQELPELVVSDKLVHVTAFGLIAALVFVSRLLPIPPPCSLAVLLIYAALDEWTQRFVPGREVEALDALASMCGVLLAAIASRIVDRQG